MNFGLLKETIAINEFQRELLLKKAVKRFGDLQGKKIAILGLAFKPETDDMREAPSINLAIALSKLGADTVAYDPVATENAKKIMGDTIKYANSIDEAITGADAVFLVTEWDIFKKHNLLAILEKMKQPIIFDGRNCLQEEKNKSL